jgi:hypothetical protein
MPEAITNVDVIAADLAANLFDPSTQRIVPFLGAGVPRSNRVEVAAPLPPTTVDEQALAKVLQTLELDGSAPFVRLFLVAAIKIALRLHAAGHATARTAEDLTKQLADADEAPSASDLAQLFAALSQYQSFESALQRMRELVDPTGAAVADADLRSLVSILAAETQIASTTEPLSSIAMYYEAFTKTRLYIIQRLRSVLRKNRAITPTHRLIAQAAERYLEDKPVNDFEDGADDYAILTTNYDCLMEAALEERQVPYIVATFYAKQQGAGDQRKRGPKLIHFRYSPHLSPEDKDFFDRFSGRAPNKLCPDREGRRPIVLVYKMHGCIHGPEENAESIVISDNDYVDFILRMSGNDGAIPAWVTRIISPKAFLFLGYSLNDWNVRAMFKVMSEKRDKDVGVPDYAVMRSYSAYDKAFFDRSDITIIKTALNTFADSVNARMPH